MRRRLMTNKLGLALAGLALLAMALTSCPSNGTGGSIRVSNVTIRLHNDGRLAPARIDLLIYPHGTPNSVRLEARVSPFNADNQSVTWESSDPNIASVDTYGNVTAGNTPGSALITVTPADDAPPASITIRVLMPTNPGAPSTHAGDLLILQAGAAAAGAVGRTFVELYNNTDAAINLEGFSLQWAEGTGTWDIIELEGSIPANSSFLVVGAFASQPETRRLYIPDTDADMIVPDFSLNNRAFRVALMQNLNTLTVHNPSDMKSEAADMREGMPPADGAACPRTIGSEVAAGLVDLLGVVNEWGDLRDEIHGAEASPAFRVSQQVAIRRASLEDTDNNFNDFILIDYRPWVASNPYRLTDEQVYIFRPRGSAYQPRNIEFPEPGQEFDPGPGTERLLILQANRSGNDNGGGGGFPNALVELFNNTNAEIDLANYYLHVGNPAGGWSWTYAISLQGIIPAQSSFLIVSTTDTNEVYRADLPEADQDAAFSMGTENAWAVAIMRNQPNLLTVDNPFGYAGLKDYYVDMLGAANNFANANRVLAFEGTTATTPPNIMTDVAETSQPQGPRRLSLEDTDVNGTDFSQADFRGHWGGTARTPNARLHRIWPRNSAAGPWNPVTGIPAVHPTVRHPVTGDVEFPPVAP